MTAKDMILTVMGQNDFVLGAYLADLSDVDLLVRPVDGQNHIAWQLGHLISAEHEFLDNMKPGSAPALPPGFVEAHSTKGDAPKSDEASRFLSKDEYVKLYQAHREATRGVLQGLDDAALDQPGPERMRDFAPTNAAFFVLMANHPMMHVGQFVAVRRKLGKPIAI